MCEVAIFPISEYAFFSYSVCLHFNQPKKKQIWFIKSGNSLNRGLLSSRLPLFISQGPWWFLKEQLKSLTWWMRRLLAKSTNALRYFALMPSYFDANVDPREWRLMVQKCKKKKNCRNFFFAPKTYNKIRLCIRTGQLRCQLKCTRTLWSVPRRSECVLLYYQLKVWTPCHKIFMLKTLCALYRFSIN